MSYMKQPLYNEFTRDYIDRGGDPYDATVAFTEARRKWIVHCSEARERKWCNAHSKKLYNKNRKVKGKSIMAEMNIWDKFDNAIDTTGLANDIKEAAENGASYKDVPHGDYEVKIDKLELIASRAGDPMVTVWFKVLTGEYKGSRIFMNQVITQGFQIHIVNEFLRSLDTGIDIEFVTYKQYGDLLMDVIEAIDGNLEYGLSYGEGKKGFSTYKITEIFEVE